MSLLRTHTLVFRSLSAGYYTTGGDWVDGSIPTDTPIEGCLQPQGSGINQEILPEGVRAEDSRLFYTQSKIEPSDQLTGQQSQTVDIEGKVFEVFASESWQGFGLLGSEHYKLILIRKDHNEV